jgi:hypothetical protein
MEVFLGLSEGVVIGNDPVLPAEEEGVEVEGPFNRMG